VLFSNTLTLTLAATLISGPAFAADLMIYQAKGQSPEQQSRDQAASTNTSADSAAASKVNAYNRAMAACMSGRGYSVK
jgi:hypothetical protein